MKYCRKISEWLSLHELTTAYYEKASSHEITRAHYEIAPSYVITTAFMKNTT